MRIQLLLAWRYLMGRKQRMVLTTLSIVFSVTLLFGLNAMIPTMEEAFRHNMITAAGKVDITITSDSNNPFDQSVLQQIKDVPGISQFSGVLEKNVLLPESMGGTINKLTGASAVTVTGVDIQTIQTVENFLIKDGRFLQTGDDAVTVIPQLLADKLKLTVGDTLSIPSSLGVENLKVVGILSLSASTGIDEILVPITTAQRILNLPDQINSVNILIKSGSDRTVVESEILAIIGSTFKSGPIEVGNELTASLVLGESMMWLIGILALAMAAFIIFNTFRTIVAERKRDLGMLRAIGATKQTIMGLIMTESLIQGLVGTAVGLVLGYLMCAGILKAMNTMIVSFLRVSLGGPVITTANLVGSILLGIGFTVGSGYFPAHAAMQVTPLEAMRPSFGAVEFQKNNKRALWGGLMIVISIFGLVLGNLTVSGLSSLVFLGGLVLIAPVLVKPVAVIFGKILSWIYPRESKLAQENLARQPGRAAITASSLMIGLAICIAIIAMITSIEHGFMIYLDKSLGSDYLLMPPSLVLGGGNLGANQNLIDRVRNTPGIKTATSLRLASSQTKGATLQIVGLDPVTYPQMAGLEFSQGDPTAAFQALADGRSMVVNGIFASGNNVKTGDMLTLKTPTGDQIYKVVGIGFDYLNGKIATGYISQANLAADFKSTSDLLLLVNRKPGADSKTTLDALKLVVNDFPAFSIIDSSEFKNEQMKIFTGVIDLFYVLVFMMAIPGLIAMANTMGINIIERTREIGTLRAVGSTQKQVRRMVFNESVLLSTLGTLMGVGVGLFLSYLLLKAIITVGYGHDFYFPTIGVVLSIVVGISFGILAAMIPARQAANTVIVEALRYE